MKRLQVISMSSDGGQISYQFVNYTRYVLRGFQQKLIGRLGSLAHHKLHRGLSRGTVADFLARVASMPGWVIYWSDEDQLLAHNDWSVAAVRASFREPHVTFTAEITAFDEMRGSDAWQALQTAIGPVLDRPPELSIDWIYGHRGETTRTRIQEHIGEDIRRLAYPWLPGGLDAFVQAFLASEEPVTVFYGAPGIGKTRLIRHLLGAMARQRNDAVRVLYTADVELIKSDSLFADFMTSDYQALVIEDADHLLMPRTDGNQNLHRFLAVSDGFIQPRGRRLLLSTNLPSRLDIDEALTRPGRCFGCFEGRKLIEPDARALMQDLCGDHDGADQGMRQLQSLASGRFSLAEVYAAARQVKTERHGPELQTTARYPAARAA